MSEFVVVSSPCNRRVRTTAVVAAEKINTVIELESAKVVTMEKLEAGEKKVYCRCWKSGTFPSRALRIINSRR